MKLTNLKRTVSSSTRVADKEPLKAFVRIGLMTVKATSYAGETPLTWRWEIWRRGIRSTKYVPVKVTQKWKKQGKWPKSRRKNLLLGTVTAVYDMGYGPIKTTYSTYDRGPKWARRIKVKRYTTTRTVTGISRYRGTKTAVVRSGMKSDDCSTLAVSKKHIREDIARLKQLKLKAPVYVVINPNEASARAKHKAGFPSLSAARADLNQKRADTMTELKRIDAQVKVMQKELPEPTARMMASLSKQFRRSKKTYKAAGVKVEVLGYTKRVDAEPRLLSEALAFRMVRWYLKPPNSKKGRWQAVIFSLTRWGRTRRAGASYAPSYTVTDYDGHDKTFAVKMNPNPNDPIDADIVLRESYENITYTSRPLGRAREELERQVAKMVKGILNVYKIDERPWEKVARGEGTERIGKYRVRVVKWGLKRGYPAITQTDKYASLGGAIVEVYKKGSKKPFEEHTFEMVRPRQLSDRKKTGAVLIRGNGSNVLGSYKSTHQARNALKRMVNDRMYELRHR